MAQGQRSYRRSIPIPSRGGSRAAQVFVTPTSVTLWVDPSCPWAWQGARWLRDLATRGTVALDWKLFSLELNASEPDTPFWQACELYGEALVALALARREGGSVAFEALYVAYATGRHDKKADPTLELVQEAGREAGLDGILERALATPDLADEIVTEFHAARDQSVFGVPTLEIDDAKVIYGPLFALAPKGDDADRMWEHARWLAERPDFFEMKRWPRDVRPGERPT